MASSSSKDAATAQDAKGEPVASSSSKKPETTLHPNDDDIKHIWETAQTFEEFSKRVRNIDFERIKRHEERVNAQILKRKSEAPVKAEKKKAKHPEKVDEINDRLKEKLQKPLVPGRVPSTSSFQPKEKPPQPLPPGQLQ